MPGVETRGMHETRREAPETSVRAVLFPHGGFSATELLILANVAVAIALVIAWGGDYRLRLLRWAYASWASVREHGAYGMFLPTLFMHVGPEHLGKNMAGLLAGAGAVEFLAGGWWAIAVYLLTGLGAAAVSYTAHNGPPLSIGASGAIMGLVGCAVAFIIRRRGLFGYAQQWKVWRVYVPMFLLLFLPTLVNADVHAHVGGFICGLVLGFVVPPHARVAALRARDPFQEEEAAPDPSD
jgi:membrane associated rhomboid family serine protease